MRPGSQNARLLEVLRRGPATNADIHREAGHMIVNSRAAELRAHGYEIECEHIDGEVGARAYRYTLLSEPGSSAAVADTASPVEQAGSLPASASTVVSETVGERQGWQPGSESGEQLTLEVAA